MNNTQKYVISFIAGLTVVSVTALAVTSQTPKNQQLSLNSTSNETLVTQRNNQSQKGNETSVTLYYADNKCEGFLSEQIKVSSNNSLEATVGKVLEKQNNGDFEIAGYRIEVDKNKKVATIDFRLPSNSDRQFISLSPCELFALFGSLRQTLTANSQWNIQEVRFTEKGQEIFL